MNVKQRYRLTRRLVTASNMSIRSEITNFATIGPLRVSGCIMDPVENYHLSLVVTLQNLVARIYVVSCGVCWVPKISDAS